MNQQQRLPRCPKGSRRNKNTGLCEQSSVIKRKSKSPTRNIALVKRKSPTISSSPTRDITLVKRKSKTKQKRCPNGSYRNKNTGLCEQKVVIIKRKSPIHHRLSLSPIKRKTIRHRLSMSPRKSPVEIKSVIKNNKKNYNEVITPKILNFYKENATPIFKGDINNHPGSFNFANIAFNYLKKRYDNLDVFTNTFDDPDPETLFFIVESNNEMNVHTTLARNVLNLKMGTYEITHDMNYDYLINQIKNILNSSRKRFFAIKISLRTGNDAHANMLIYDREKNTLELFDPNSYITMSIFKPEKVKFLINYIFSKIKDNIRFIDSYDIYPLKGLQIEQAEEYLNQSNEIEGYCGAWSFFYLHMRIANPNMPQFKLIKQLKVEIKNKGNFFNMIRNYVKYIFNNGYRHKYNIKPVRLRL